MKENKCVCCDASIPEGCQTCKKCNAEPFKPKAKIKATAKIDELKKWVYKHFIGVYIGIGIATCLLMLMIGIVIGQAVATPIQGNEQEVQHISAEKAMTNNTSTSDFELIFRSTSNE